MPRGAAIRGRPAKALASRRPPTIVERAWLPPEDRARYMRIDMKSATRTRRARHPGGVSLIVVVVLEAIAR